MRKEVMPRQKRNKVFRETPMKWRTVEGEGGKGGKGSKERSSELIFCR